MPEDYIPTASDWADLNKYYSDISDHRYVRTHRQQERTYTVNTESGSRELKERDFIRRCQDLVFQNEDDSPVNGIISLESNGIPVGSIIKLLEISESDYQNLKAGAQYPYLLTTWKRFFDKKRFLADQEELRPIREIFGYQPVNDEKCDDDLAKKRVDELLPDIRSRYRTNPEKFIRSIINRCQPITYNQIRTYYDIPFSLCRIVDNGKLLLSQKQLDILNDRFKTIFTVKSFYMHYEKDKINQVHRDRRYDITNRDDLVSYDKFNEIMTEIKDTNQKLKLYEIADRLLSAGYITSQIATHLGVTGWHIGASRRGRAVNSWAYHTIKELWDIEIADQISTYIYNKQ